jgi:hypothetical protein
MNNARFCLYTLPSFECVVQPPKHPLQLSVAHPPPLVSQMQQSLAVCLASTTYLKDVKLIVIYPLPYVGSNRDLSSETLEIRIAEVHADSSMCVSIPVFASSEAIGRPLDIQIKTWYSNLEDREAFLHIPVE